MKPLRAVHHVGMGVGARDEHVTVLEFLPGGEQFPQPMAIYVDEQGHLSYTDVNTLTIEEGQLRELEWQSGWAS